MKSIATYKFWVTLGFIAGIVLCSYNVINALKLGNAWLELANSVIVLFPIFVMIMVLDRLEVHEEEIAKLKGASIKHNILADDRTPEPSIKQDNKKYEFSRDMFPSEWDYEQYKKMEDEKNK